MPLLKPVEAEITETKRTFSCQAALPWGSADFTLVCSAVLSRVSRIMTQERNSLHSLDWLSHFPWLRFYGELFQGMFSELTLCVFT